MESNRRVSGFGKHDKCPVSASDVGELDEDYSEDDTPVVQNTHRYRPSHRSRKPTICTKFDDFLRITSSLALGHDGFVRK